MPTRVVPREILCRSALNKTGIPGFDYCMNPYVGCMHKCPYCYASFMCRFTGHKEKWGEFLDVKVNFPEVLAKQLSSRRSKPTGSVIIGTVTDAYQPAEARYQITRSSLEILAAYQLLEVQLLTKSALVLRDLDIISQIKNCAIGFTITHLDPDAALILEPGASLPHLRLAAARELVKAGIPVWVFIAPLLPGISDTEAELDRLLNSLQEAGIEEILLDWLNPYPAVVHNLKNVYREFFPQALPHLNEYLHAPGMYRDKIAGRLDQISALTGCHPDFV